MEPSVKDWRERLRSRALSSRELVEHYLDKIASVNPRVNAVVALNEGALEEADAADAALKAGDDRPLLGLPLTVKDSIDTAGVITTGGSLARREFVPDQDATVIKRLRAAGGIVLGKTNVPEYTWSSETTNLVYGRTLNPFDPSRTAGGSSGGEGAIVGMDASPLGVASDGGGSIRTPSHYCGTVGLRPSVGRVPETGAWPDTRATGMMGMSCIGPIARYVADLELLLEVISGPDKVDPYAVPVPLLRAADAGELRAAFFVFDGVAQTTQGTEAALRDAAAELGAVEVQPPDVSEATSLFFAAMGADGGAQARADLANADRIDPALAAQLSSLQALSAEEFFALQRRIYALRARVLEFLADWDVVLCPVCAGPAPPHGVAPGPDPSLGPAALSYLRIFSLAGVPVAVVPVGVEDGMPIGAQLVANPFREDKALSAAETLYGRPWLEPPRADQAPRARTPAIT